VGLKVKCSEGRDMIDQILSFVIDVAGITALVGITLFVAFPSVIDAVKKSL